MNAAAQDMNEKKNEMSAAGKSVVDRVAFEVKQLDPREVKRAAVELGSNARDVATEAYGSTLGFVRRNPVATALGLCAFGFLAGVITGHVRKSA